jgi:hypothetical protein
MNSFSTLGTHFSALPCPFTRQKFLFVFQQYGRSWRCATRSWGRGSWSTNGSCSTSSSRIHPTTSVVSIMSTEPFKVNTIAPPYIVSCLINVYTILISFRTFFLFRCSFFAPVYKTEPRSHGIKQRGTDWAPCVACVLHDIF